MPHSLISDDQGLHEGDQSGKENSRDLGNDIGREELVGCPVILHFPVMAWRILQDTWWTQDDYPDYR
jgi:hypothetical protein